VPTTLSAAEYDGIFGMTFEGTKDLYADPRLSPRTVLLDPAATEDTPAQLWASSGIRALDHAVEIFLSRSPTPVTDAACLHAVRLLAANLPRTLADPGDAESRARCQQAAWLSMLGVENVTLGLCHGIGHQIGARCNVPHGITSCVMLPTVLEAMVELMPGRCAELALAMGAGDAGLPEAQLAAALPTAVRGFVASLGLPTTLSEVGVAEEDFELIAHDSVRDFVVASAPLQVEEGDVVRLLRQALR
jgi:alcohol dehydrogenase class IV